MSNDRLVRLPEVMTRTGLSRSSIYRLMGRGDFPQREPISANVVAWRESDLDRWIANPMAWKEAA